MNGIYGRKKELDLLETVLTSEKCEFLAVYGRRRVGKTHLIREFFQKRVDLYFEVTGEKDAAQAVQRHAFKQRLEQVFYADTPIPPLESWRKALRTLANALKSRLASGRIERVVIFLDELPWMATRKSGLVQALDHIWNTELSRMPQVILVVCGSAASWMIDHLIHAKGGLHNRVTRQLRLAPFTLRQTAGFLQARKLSFNLRTVAEIYMAIGGIPHYLLQLDKRLSASQNIAALCFSENGMLRTEFDSLFRALFGESAVYERIVRVLAKKRNGVARDELLKALKAASGGRINRRLKELEEAGFIGRLQPYGRKIKQTLYRIVDPYVYFYLSWIENAPGGILSGQGEKYWLEKSRSPAYVAWAGYAFENLCLTHSVLIQEALGLNHASYEVGSWSYSPPKGQSARRGAQIDLLFDRSDGIVSICEIKFSPRAFMVDKTYAQELKNKLAVFESVTRTRKQLQLVLVVFDGFKANTWSEGLVDAVLDAQEIFTSERG